MDGVVYILDLLRGSYFGLDPSWSGAWFALTSGAPVDADNPADVALLAAARREGWVLDSAHRAGLRAQRRADGTLVRHLARRQPAVAAWYALARTTLRLRWRGFWPTYSALLWSDLPAPDDETHPIEVGAAAFLRAEQVFISRRGVDDCLARSLALFSFLRTGCKLAAHHVIGVRRYPFAAHAWVEYEGNPVVDKPDRVASFTPIAHI